MSDEQLVALRIVDALPGEDERELLDELIFLFDVLGFVERPTPPKPLKRSEWTHCSKGHPYTRYPSGKKVCQPCANENQRKRRPVKPCFLCGGVKDTGRRAKLCSKCRELADYAKAASPTKSRLLASTEYRELAQQNFERYRKFCSRAADPDLKELLGMICPQCARHQHDKCNWPTDCTCQHQEVKGESDDGDEAGG